MQGAVLYKMSGSGNDFVFADGRVAPAETWAVQEIRQLCARRTGIGADGFVVLEPGSEQHAVRFHFFNSDGRRASLCGNAALCATRLAAWLGLARPEGMLLETDVGKLATRCLAGSGERAEIEVPSPGTAVVPEVALDDGEQSMHRVDVGVPHLVVLVEDLQAVAVCQRGRELRSHKALGRAGANVNFVAGDRAEWGMRTYERGVEDETLACGTGAVAVATVLARIHGVRLPWNVRTVSGCVLTVSGELQDGTGIAGARLAGEGRLVFRAILGG
jgi:diaminopimelate epimerase